MIKATDFISDEAKKTAQTEALGVLVDVFVKEMGADIFSNLEKGYAGWDETKNADEIKRRLLTSFQNGDMVTVASCAMFLWNLQKQ